MTTLKKIATELLRDCPAESLDDHNAIASALRSGDTQRALDLCGDYPETYSWLKSQLKNTTKSRAAATLGRIKSPAKAAAVRENGKRGGRPRAPWVVGEADEGWAWLCRGKRQEIKLYLNRVVEIDRHGRESVDEPDDDRTPLGLFCKWDRVSPRDARTVCANHREFVGWFLSFRNDSTEFIDPYRLLVD